MPLGPTLSPRGLLSELALTIDSELLPGVTVYDVGWTRDRSALRLELAGASRRTVRLDVREPGVSCDDPALAAALGPILLPRLRGRTLEGAEATTLIEALAPEPLGPEVPLPAGPEAAPLRAEIANWRRHCGAAPRVRDLGDGEVALHYPAPTGAALIGALRPVRHTILERRAHREWIRALGFSIARDGVLRGVPTPAAFARRTKAAGLRPAVLPVLARIVGSQQGPAWAEALLDGAFVVGVPRRWSLAVPGLRVPVSTMAHDLGVHCLPLAWVDAALWTTLRAHVAEAGGPRGLVRWFEGPLTTACWDAWAGCDRPEDVAAAIAQRWPQISAALPPGWGS